MEFFKICNLSFLLIFVFIGGTVQADTLEVIPHEYALMLIINSPGVEAELAERIDKGDLLSPEGVSAYDTYINYTKSYPDDISTQKKLKRTLISALAKVADQALGEYFDEGGAFIYDYMSEASKNRFGKVVPIDQYYYVAAELSGSDHFLYDGLQAKGLFMEALKLWYIEAQDLEAIENKLKASLILTMDASYTYYELGLVYFEKGAYQLAYENLDLARRLNPKWALPQEQLQLVEEALGLSKND